MCKVYQLTPRGEVSGTEYGHVSCRYSFTRYGLRIAWIPVKTGVCLESRGRCTHDWLIHQPFSSISLRTWLLSLLKFEDLVKLAFSSHKRNLLDNANHFFGPYLFFIININININIGTSVQILNCLTKHDQTLVSTFQPWNWKKVHGTIIYIYISAGIQMEKALGLYKHLSFLFIYSLSDRFTKNL